MTWHTLHRWFVVAALMQCCLVTVRSAGADDSVGREDAERVPLGAVVGRLSRNPQSGDGELPYVVLNRAGVVQAYLQPSDHVDLERYVDRYVRNWRRG